MPVRCVHLKGNFVAPSACILNMLCLAFIFLSSIDYFNQLSSLKKLLFGQANDDDQVKQCSLPAKKNPETLALYENEINRNIYLF